MFSRGAEGRDFPGGGWKTLAAFTDGGANGLLESAQRGRGGRSRAVVLRGSFLQKIPASGIGRNVSKSGRGSPPQSSFTSGALGRCVKGSLRINIR